MTAVYLSPFEEIVGVSWGGGAKRVLAILIHATVGATNSGSPPSLAFEATVTIKTKGGDVANNKIVIARTGAPGPAPPIFQFINSDILAYYAMWTYDPYILTGTVNESTGGNFWYINTDGTFGTFPDFVPSPYATLADAEAYLDAQKTIHPEYVGKTFIISYLNPFDNFSQNSEWRALAFINLDAFAKDGFGQYFIDFSMKATGDNIAGSARFDAQLVKGDPATMNFEADAQNNPSFTAPAVAFYDYNAAGIVDGTTTFGGTLVVHTADDTLTGPASPSGGGG